MMKKPPLKLFVFIDALGWDIVRRHEAFPWLQEYRKPARTILGYSCTCIPSIITGQWPQEHGRWTFFSKAKGKSSLEPLSMLKWLPRKLSHHHRFRHHLSRLYASHNDFSGYFNLYNLPYKNMSYFEYGEKKDLFSTKLSDLHTIFHELEENNVPYYCADWKASESDNLQNFMAYEKQKRCDWAFLYFPRLDGIMHLKGPEGAGPHIRWYEQQIQTLMSELSQKREVHLTVFSDHGMTKIHKHLDISATDGTSRWQEGKDYMAFYDATLARYWFHRDEVRNDVLRQLQRSAGGRVLSEEELKQEKVWFPDQRFGETIFLADPGVLLYPNHMGEHPPLGMHGFSPNDRDSWASVLSNRAETADILGENPSIRDYFRLMKEGCCA